MAKAGREAYRRELFSSISGMVKRSIVYTHLPLKMTDSIVPV